MARGSFRFLKITSRWIIRICIAIWILVIISLLYLAFKQGKKDDNRYIDNYNCVNVGYSDEYQTQMYQCDTGLWQEWELLVKPRDQG